MKRSDTNESIIKNYEGKLPDKYQIYELVDTIRAFFRAYFGDAVKVDSNITESYYILLKGKEFAMFLKESLKLQRGKSTLHIYMENTIDLLNIVIGTKNGLEISEEERIRLNDLAIEGDFAMEIIQGTIIIRHKIYTAESIPLNANKRHIPLYDDLRKVFFGDII